MRHVRRTRLPQLYLPDPLLNLAMSERDDATFRTERLIPYSRDAVFAAFADADLLARWWGPDGFTNTFEIFEFAPGGRWKFMMHGPNGAQFPNESTFLEVDRSSRIVIHHISKPRYVLLITLAAHDTGTTITWTQQFEEPSVAARIRHIVEPANEQNLDRLEGALAESIGRH